MALYFADSFSAIVPDKPHIKCLWFNLEENEFKTHEVENREHGERGTHRSMSEESHTHKSKLASSQYHGTLKFTLLLSI